MKQFYNCLGLVFMLGLVPLFAYAQRVDSLITLSYTDAKQRLIKENLSLLAAYYEISAAEADLVQAKLWSNPYLVWNQDMYSVEKNEYFNFTNQRLIQINQTFSVAGKHTNTVKLAKVGIEINKLMMQDVLRSLLFELGEKYLALNALQQKEALYNKIVSEYEDLIKNAENKLRVGAIPLNEVTRLKSELITVKTDAFDNRNDIFNEMSELKTLLNFSDNAYIQTLDRQTDSLVVLNVDNLIVEALESRADYQLSKKQLVYEERNLKLQKSLAMSDIMLGYQPSDKGSNYVRPYTGLVLEMYMPIFDRNQGNIQKAKVRIEQAKSGNRLNDTKIRNEVQQSLAQLLNYKQGFDQFSDSFRQIIEDLNRNSVNNYDKKNINLLEYIDLQRIYIKNQIEYIDMKNDYQKSINKLNFSVGKQVIE